MNRVLKATLTAFTLTLTLSVFAQKTTRINFQVTGFTEGAAKLLGIFGDQNFLFDTTRIATDGKFSFVNKDSIPQGMYYVLLPDGRNIQVFVANGENDFTLSTTKNNLSLGMKVEGSLENELYYNGIRYQTVLEAKYNALMPQLQAAQPNSPQFQQIKAQMDAALAERDVRVVEEYKKYPNSLFTTFKMAGQNPKLRMTFLPNGTLDSAKTMVNYRYDFWDGFNFADGRLIRTPVFINKIKKYMTELTPQNPDTIIAAAEHLLERAKVNDSNWKDCYNWVLAQYKPAQTKLMDGEAVYSHFVLKYMTAKRFPEIDAADIESTRKRAEEMTQSLLGLIGKDVWGYDKNSQKRTLYSIKSRFKVIFIYNPECEHCQEMTPDLRHVYDQWKSRGLEIFSIAANAKSVDEWQGFVKKYGVNWIDVLDPNIESLYHLKYFIDVTPEVYLLDQNFRIIAKNIKPSQLSEILTDELRKNQ